MEKSTEAALAAGRNEDQRRIYRRRRWTAVIGAIASLLFVCIGLYFGAEFVLIVSAGALIIAALFYFDANGHLHELRRRSSTVLSPNFSLLKDSETTSDPEAARRHLTNG